MACVVLVDEVEAREPLVAEVSGVGAVVALGEGGSARAVARAGVVAGAAAGRADRTGIFADPGGAHRSIGAAPAAPAAVVAPAGGTDSRCGARGAVLNEPDRARERRGRAER
jgi:hypothetical protein